MANTMLADPFHDAAIISPVERPCVHMMATGIVDHTNVTVTLALIMYTIEFSSDVVLVAFSMFHVLS